MPRRRTSLSLSVLSLLVLLLTATSASHAQQPGLLGWWNRPATGKYLDLTPRQNHAVLRGNASFAGNALRLPADRASACAEVARHEDYAFPNGFTLSVHARIASWYNNGRAADNQFMLVQRSAGSQYSFRFQITGDYDYKTSPHELTLVMGQEKLFRSGATPSLGAWHHLAATYDMQRVRLYLDGKCVLDKPYDNPVPPPAAPLLIGRHDHSSNDFRYYFNGEMRDLRIYDRALDAAGIGRLKGATPPDPPVVEKPVSAPTWAGLWRTQYEVIVMRQKGDAVSGVFHALDGSFHGDFKGRADGATCSGTWRFVKAPQDAPPQRDFQLTLINGGRVFTGGRGATEVRGVLLDRLPKSAVSIMKDIADFSGVWWSAYDVSIMVQTDDLVSGVGWTHDGALRVEMKGKVTGQQATGEWVHHFKDGLTEKGDFTVSFKTRDTMTGTSRNQVKNRNYEFTATRIARLTLPESAATVRHIAWPQWQVSFDVPADWKQGDSNASRKIFFKPSFGQVEVTAVKLPPAFTLDQFAAHVASKITSLTLEKDQGFEKLGQHTARVHRYKHETKRGYFLGYLFKPRPHAGFWFLLHVDHENSLAVLRKVLDSVRFNTAAGVPEKLEPVKPRPPVVEPSPDKPTDADSLNPRHYKAFGKFNAKGSFNGHVFLADLHDKSAYPVFLAIYPVVPIKEKGTGKYSGNYRRVGKPFLTATDEHGNYHLDLPEGMYRADLYDAKGRIWKLVSGDEMFHCTRARKLHHFKIDNKGG